jgi:hypothetical protein
VDSNFYSVPDTLVGKEVTVKKYPYLIKVSINDKALFETKRLIGKNQYRVDINHYLRTLKKKPGAIANSLALKQAVPWLQEMFTKYYGTKPKEFIPFLSLVNRHSLFQIKEAVRKIELKKLTVDNEKIGEYLVEKEVCQTADTNAKKVEGIDEACLTQLQQINQLFGLGGDA